MRHRWLSVPVLVLPTIATLALASAESEACGPYGSFERDVEVEVYSERPATAGVTVTATCGEVEFVAKLLPNGHYLLIGLPRSRCEIEATAHECYLSDRVVTASAGTSLRHLQIEIPS